MWSIYPYLPPQERVYVWCVVRLCPPTAFTKPMADTHASGSSFDTRSSTRRTATVMLATRKWLGGRGSMAGLHAPPSTIRPSWEITALTGSVPIRRYKDIRTTCVASVSG